MNKKSQGFTLIEILVALVLITIIAGVLIISLFSQDEKGLKTETVRLQQALIQAADFSRLSGKKIAWESDGKSYKFLAETVENNREVTWQSFTPKRYSADTFINYTFSGGITITKIIIARQEQKISDDALTPPPRIYLYPNGINPTFTITLISKNPDIPARELQGTPIGQVIDVEEERLKKLEQELNQTKEDKEIKEITQ